MCFCAFVIVWERMRVRGAMNGQSPPRQRSLELHTIRPTRAAAAGAASLSGCFAPRCAMRRPCPAGQAARAAGAARGGCALPSPQPGAHGAGGVVGAGRRGGAHIPGQLQQGRLLIGGGKGGGGGEAVQGTQLALGGRAARWGASSRAERGLAGVSCRNSAVKLGSAAVASLRP